MGRLKIGIIGAGRIGKIHAKSICNYVENAYVKTISDPFAPDLEEFAKSLGIENITKNYLDIINDPQIDAVIICSPTNTHSQISIEAAKAGKHIFCEKPVDFDINRIQNVIDEVKKANVKMQVGFNRRFDHNFAKVKELINKGQVGDIHTVRITSRDPAPPPIEYIKVSGGIFTDMTIHDFDMALFMANSKVKEVYAHANCLIDPEIGKAGDYDTAVIMLKFENGATGIIENSRKAVYGYDQRIEVFGSKGSISAENDTPTKVTVKSEERIETDKPLYFFLERYMDSFIEEMKQFVDAIENNKPTPVNQEDGLTPVLLAIAAKKSVLENRPVLISEIYESK